MCLYRRLPEVWVYMPDSWLSSKVVMLLEALDQMKRYVILIGPRADDLFRTPSLKSLSWWVSTLRYVILIAPEADDLFSASSLQSLSWWVSTLRESGVLDSVSRK